MKEFRIPQWVYKHLIDYHPGTEQYRGEVARLRKGLEKYKVDKPEASIVIPAYNEQFELMRTLSSLSDLELDRPTELIVVNNNSTDDTQKILDDCGVRSVFEPVQSITHARQTGLETARGIYLLSADADSIYPSLWAKTYIDALQDPEVSCVYGKHSFIPCEGNSRSSLAVYEIVAETLFKIRRKNRDYLNVLGFNFAFRREDGFAVGGYNVKRKRWQDGWMAMSLLDVGKIRLINGPATRVWTSDRRLMTDGSLWKAFMRRAQIHGGRLGGYLGKKHKHEQFRKEELNKTKSHET